jgi:uncharacterized RDD family membrane protein YckC
MEDEEISIFPERPAVYGTFWQRLGAVLIDTLILSIPNQIMVEISGHNFYSELFNNHNVDFMGLWPLLISTIIDWLYYSLMQSSQSQATVGKMALSLKVTDINGNRISFGRATGRYFGKTISALILLIGYFMMLWDDRNQTLHDKMAGTLVVKKSPSFQP